MTLSAIKRQPPDHGVSSMPRKVRFADESKTVNTSVGHREPYNDIQCDKLYIKSEPEIQQESRSTTDLNQNSPERQNDCIVDVDNGVMLAHRRAQEAMMRARAIQSNVRHQQEVLHHIVECENRQQLKISKQNRKQAQAEAFKETAFKETDILSISMAWISDVFQGIQK